MKRFQYPRLLLVFALFGLLALEPAASESESANEPDPYELKAALYYKFAKFVTWPESVFEDETSPVIFGVLGKDPFGDKLERTLLGRTIEGRNLVVRRFEKPADLDQVQLLFVCDSPPMDLKEIAALTREDAVLLVGDMPRFAHDGGMINIYRRGSSFRFEVNTDAVDRAELVIDAKLLQLARTIRD